MNDRSRRPHERTGERERHRDRGTRDGHGEWQRRDADDQNEWRDGFGAYGFSGTEKPAEPGKPRSGYGEQGFGAGEGHGGSWGGGERGGYGGGQPGGLHGSRGGGWSAEGERYERGRGPRSYGPEGWGGAPEPPAMGQGRGDSAGAPVDTGSSAGARWSVPTPFDVRRPQAYQPSEQAIRDGVRERLTRHGHLDASRITVQVEKNDVILDGSVDSRASSRMAEEAAQAVPRVHHVHNRLHIEG